MPEGIGICGPRKTGDRELIDMRASGIAARALNHRYICISLYSRFKFTLK